MNNYLLDVTDAAQQTVEKAGGFVQNFLDSVADFALSAGVRLVGALLLVIIGFRVINFLVKKLCFGRAFSRLEKSASSFISSLISISLKILVAVTAAAVLGIPMTNIVAIVGSCGLAIGLSLQGSLSNLAGGLMILIFKPFKVGDYISACGNEGTVREISIFYTTILTNDCRTVVIPNGTLSNSSLSNSTAKGVLRQDINVSVCYSADTDEVMNTLREIIACHAYIKEDPPANIVISELADSAVIFTVRFYTDFKDYWTAYYEIREEIKRVFDSRGIEFPFPQLDVHIDGKK